MLWNVVRYVCFSIKGGSQRDRVELPKSANRRLMHRSKYHSYRTRPKARCVDGHHNALNHEPGGEGTDRAHISNKWTKLPEPREPRRRAMSSGVRPRLKSRSPLVSLS